MPTHTTRERRQTVEKADMQGASSEAPQIVQNIATEKIQPGNNDRQDFEPVALQELADSIKQHGLAQPITVRPLALAGGGGELGELFEIVAGERRFRAMQLMGMDKVPCLVRVLSDEQASAIMLLENIHRADLNPLDEAQAYHKRIVQFGWTVAQCAKHAEVSPGRVQGRLDLLSLTWEVQSLVKSGNMGLEFARSLLGLDSNFQLQALRYFTGSRRPALAEFRTLCSKLLEQQNQNALFDLEAFAKQQQACVDKREHRKAFPYAVSQKLPPMKARRSITDTLEAYIGQLGASQDPQMQEAARIVGTVFCGLVQGNFVRPPKSADRLLGE